MADLADRTSDAPVMASSSVERNGITARIAFQKAKPSHGGQPSVKRFSPVAARSTWARNAFGAASYERMGGGYEDHHTGSQLVGP